MNFLTSKGRDRRWVAIEEALGLLNNGVEDGLEIGGRAANDAEDVACRRLVFECGPELGVPGLNLFEKTRVRALCGRLLLSRLRKFAPGPGELFGQLLDPRSAEPRSSVGEAVMTAHASHTTCPCGFGVPHGAG